MKDKTLIVMGNGPSLKDVDFDMLSGYDTFGLNAAYRAYPRLNWWPTYHGCFDYRVTDNHKENFIDLINSKKFKKHFYIRNLSNEENGNSGANACSVGVCLGYKKIILLGVDCNYVEFVEGSKKDGPGGLVMEKTPGTNPNYWFDDYQQKGDEYNIPDGLSFHMPTWNTFAYRAAHANIEVVNCSPITTLRSFKRMSLREALL